MDISENNENMESGTAPVPDREAAVELPAEKKSVETPAPKPSPAKKPVKKPLEPPAEQYRVSSSPHVFGKDTVSKIMWTVSFCLLPAGLSSIYIFGLHALLVILFSIGGAVLAEYLWQKITKSRLTLSDGSAFLTGLLLAYNLPPSVPLWLPVVGSFFAIIIAKQFFGGLGNNIFNPALAARGFLLASWPQQMTTWWEPIMNPFALNSKTVATPLALMKEGGIDQFIGQFQTNGQMLSALFWGNRGGCLGETAVFFLLLGGLYLIYKKYIDWQVPVTYILTTGILAVIFYRVGDSGNPMSAVNTFFFTIMSGGLILGAFFMATDYVTIPSTLKGRIIFALSCGILTAVIRRWGGYPEGVCYSILIMNAFTPLIDSRTKTTVYGAKKEKKAE